MYFWSRDVINLPVSIPKQDGAIIENLSTPNSFGLSVPFPTRLHLTPELPGNSSMKGLGLKRFFSNHVPDF